MKILITPDRVLAIAFADGEWLPPGSVPEPLIGAAAERHLLPVTGRALYEKLLDGEYPDLTERYAAPALALHVRLMLQPLLDIRTGRYGTTAPSSGTWKPAPDSSVRRLDRALRRQAAAHLRRLSRHLDAHCADYPEYEPEKNILHRCTIHGDLIQTV